MPPGTPPPRDPNLIDVSLSLWPGQSEQAMVQLAQALSALNEHLQAADLPNTVANLQGANRVLQTYTRQDQVFEGGRSPGAAQTQGGAGTVSQPEDAAGQAASRGGPQEGAQAPVDRSQQGYGSPSGAGDRRVDPHERTIRQRLGQIYRASRGQEAEGYTPTEGNRRDRIGGLIDYGLGLARPAGSTGPTPPEYDPAVTGGVPPQGPGGPPPGGWIPPMGPGGGSGDGGDRSSGASVGGPGDPDENDPNMGWLRHVRRENLDQPIQFPRFGELTTQDKLRMASDWLARNQLQRNDRAAEAGENAPGQWQGRASAALGIAANNYAQYRVIRDNIARAGLAVGISRAGEQGQAGLGYSQQGGNVGFNIFGTEIGGELPILGPLLSEAGRQNIRREFEIRRLSASPQISGEQAREIFDTINAQGYSSGEADNLAFRLYQPLVRQGASAQAIGSVTDEAYRYGNTSIDALRESLQGLGNAARNTRQSVDQVIEGLGEFAQTAAERGSTIGRGLMTGREFVEATGQRPEVASRALQNPLFQSLAMQRTGLLPTQQGTLTGTEIADTQNRMVQMAMQMTRGFNRPRTETLTDAQGRTVTRHIAGRDAQIAQAASIAGMDVETFRQTLRHQSRQNSYSVATEALAAWSDDVRRAHAGSQTQGPLRGGINDMQWGQVADELAAAGVSRDRIRDISGRSFQDRASAAQQALETISDRQRSSKNTVEIRLTGMAEKMFQAKFAGGNKGGHSDTSIWKTAEGIGIDAFKSLPIG